MADSPPLFSILRKRILQPLICFINDPSLRIILTISNCLALLTIGFGLLSLAGIYLEMEYGIATIYHDGKIGISFLFVPCALFTALGILMTATFYTMFLIFLLSGLSWMVMAIVGYPPYRLLWSALKAIHRKRLKVRQQLPGEIVTEIVQCLPYEERIRLAESTRYIYEIVGDLMEEALGTLKVRLERKNREVTVVKRLISGMEAVINYTYEDDAALGRRVTTRVISGKLDGKALAGWLFAAGYLLLVGVLIWTAIPYLMNRYQSNTRNLLLVDPAFDPKVVVGMGDGAAVRSNNNYSTLIASREDLWLQYAWRINQSGAATPPAADGMNVHGGGVPPMPRRLYDVWIDKETQYVGGIVLFINNPPSESERLWDDVAEFIYDAFYTTRKALPVLVACTRGGNFNSSTRSVSNLDIRTSIANRIRMIGLSEEEEEEEEDRNGAGSKRVKIIWLGKKLTMLVTVVGCAHPYSAPASKLVMQQWKESITGWYDKYLGGV